MNAIPKLLPTTALAARYDKTPRTIENWEKTRPHGFPLPFRVNHRKFWREDEILGWEERCLEAAKAGASHEPQGAR